VVVDDGFERTTLALAAPLDVPAPRPAAALSEEALAATSGPATLDQAPGEAFPWRRTRASQKQPKAVDGPAAPKEERPETPAPRSRRHAQASNEPVNLDESVDSLLASL